MDDLTPIQRRTYPIDWTGTLVYIAYGRERRLLYVGITDDIHGRMGHHRRTSGWWSQAVKIEVEQYPTRSKARVRESQLISTLAPEWNVEGQTGNAAVQVRRRQKAVECVNGLLGCHGWALDGMAYCRECWDYGYCGDPPANPKRMELWQRLHS